MRQILLRVSAIFMRRRDRQIERRGRALIGLVERQLPQKLVVIHQFTSGMIEDKERVLERPGLAITMNVDGFGNRANKRTKYVEFTADVPRFHDGFKLFYEEDTDLMDPRAVLALGPPPDLIVYE